MSTPPRTPVLKWGGLATDVEGACLLMAALLEQDGRADDAAVLRLDLVQKLIRAALHESEHPGPIALGHEMYMALKLQSGVQGGVRGKATKKPSR